MIFVVQFLEYIDLLSNNNNSLLRERERERERERSNNNISKIWYCYFICAQFDFCSKP